MFITEMLLGHTRPLGLVTLCPGGTVPCVGPQKETAKATRPNHLGTTNWRHRQRLATFGRQE
eukprot:10823922-Alexandrium_andersonii.AAC.1